MLINDHMAEGYPSKHLMEVSCTNVNKEGNYQHDDCQLQLGVLYGIQ